MDREFWQFSDQLRLQNQDGFAGLSIGDSIWSPPLSNSAAAPWKSNSPGLIGSGKLAFRNATTANADRYNNFPAPVADINSQKMNANKSIDYYGKNLNLINGGGREEEPAVVKNYFNKSVGRPANNNSSKKQSSGRTFKSLPASEALPRNEAIGGYIFVCNNDTMEENLKRRLFGLPSRYRDSVRAIRPGLPLFLYNYSTHQLHGIFEAASFGGSNIDAAAWEDKKPNGESRFPAQVRVATRKICEPLEEDAFRPILHHYDGPKFRLELSVSEAISLLDIFAEKQFV